MFVSNLWENVRLKCNGPNGEHELVLSVSESQRKRLLFVLVNGDCVSELPLYDRSSYSSEHELVLSVRKRQRKRMVALGSSPYTMAQFIVASVSLS